MPLTTINRATRTTFCTHRISINWAGVLYLFGLPWLFPFEINGRKQQERVPIYEKLPTMRTPPLFAEGRRMNDVLSTTTVLIQQQSDPIISLRFGQLGHRGRGRGRCGRLRSGGAGLRRLSHAPTGFSHRHGRQRVQISTRGRRSCCLHGGSGGRMIGILVDIQRQSGLLRSVCAKACGVECRALAGGEGRHVEGTDCFEHDFGNVGLEHLAFGGHA